MRVAQSGDLILAVDPGREKCGLAVVSLSGKVIAKRVVSRHEIVDEVGRLLAAGGVGPVVVGDRTGSREFRAELARLGVPNPSHEVVCVNEHLSSQEARLRYLKEHPGRGLARFLPVTLRSPAEPIDDYVAVILAQRYLAGLAGRKAPNGD